MWSCVCRLTLISSTLLFGTTLVNKINTKIFPHFEHDFIQTDSKILTNNIN